MFEFYSPITEQVFNYKPYCRTLRHKFMYRVKQLLSCEIIY